MSTDALSLHRSSSPAENSYPAVRTAYLRIDGVLAGRPHARAVRFSVGVRGLEPLASSVSRKRSTRLSYTPLGGPLTLPAAQRWLARASDGQDDHWLPGRRSRAASAEPRFRGCRGVLVRVRWLGTVP